MTMNSRTWAGILALSLILMFPVLAAASVEYAPKRVGVLSDDPGHRSGLDQARADDGGVETELNGHGHAGPNLGEILPLWACLPFAFMLLSIAFLPLVASEFWHHHFGKISAFWAACLGIPFLIVFKGAALYEILHIILADYIPFILLLWGLYTVSGGILLRGRLRGTPLVNSLILITGAALASWMGTTGAAMLLIRPFMRANDYRKNKTFMIVFFIFLVANIGGSLTPLGDPPLFLGFLHGVDFFWTFNLAPHMLLAGGMLIVIYFILDSHYYRKEGASPPKEESGESLRLEGAHNFIFLGGIIGAVLASGIFDWGTVNTFGVHRGAQDWARDFFLILMGGLSLITTPMKIHEDNNFTWFPMVEVACLFIGIFITMIPCLLILKAGPGGGMAFLIASVKEPVHYFWVTGALSSFLDNAPTYLTFFNTALGTFYPGMPESGAVALFIKEHEIYLKAISSAAVFFGACSYIGNAPNFMVRSIAEEAGINMPSFFGYIVKYSLVFLLPVFMIVTLVFFWE